MKNLCVCVAGPMAAGKNIVTSILEKNNFATIDADFVTHKILNLDDVITKVTNEFSELATQKKINIITSKGKIDRKNLGRLIFANQALIERHEKIVYPKITNALLDFIKTNKEKNVAINATLLFKIPKVMQKIDLIIFVDAPAVLRFFRAKKRDNINARQILQRFKSQKNLLFDFKTTQKKIAVVQNANNIINLEKKILCVLKNNIPNGGM